MVEGVTPYICVVPAACGGSALSPTVGVIDECVNSVNALLATTTTTTAAATKFSRYGQRQQRRRWV
ncbi:unnamed protein product [Ceratitis capitata]|uniref:(Mediterranean fruit fly) hypothetical protein n=1 Tax=Ceratitis capitata TaxID=7213 RepID=A0A811U5G9_CERCA|nr:unnamed protein product [Ceratitis capitata]